MHAAASLAVAPSNSVRTNTCLRFSDTYCFHWSTFKRRSLVDHTSSVFSPPIASLTFSPIRLFNGGPLDTDQMVLEGMWS